MDPRRLVQPHAQGTWRSRPTLSPGRASAGLVGAPICLRGAFPAARLWFPAVGAHPPSTAAVSVGRAFRPALTGPGTRFPWASCRCLGTCHGINAYSVISRPSFLSNETLLCLRCFIRKHSRPWRKPAPRWPLPDGEIKHRRLWVPNFSPANDTFQ